MKNPPNKSWRSLGIVAITCGVLDGIVFSLARVIASVYEAKHSPLSENAQRLTDAVSGVKGVANLSVGMPLLAAVLVVVGIGLCVRARWARAATIAWSVTAIIFLVVMVALDIAIVWPRIDAAEQAAIQSGASANALMGYAAAKGASVRNAVLRAPFPIILLLLVGRRRPTAAIDAPTVSA